MSLLDAINDRISQLQAATDANYKAAGYEVPTSAQRKAAELTGQNPYEYATQLKQIETAQKEAEKAAKAAQKQAAKAARQSSSRSSSGSSKKSKSSQSTSAPSGNTGAMSSLFGSESETIPSIKDSAQTKQEAAKAWASSRKKDSASKLVQASTAALQGVKFGNKKSENNVKSTSTTSTPKAEESSAKTTSASNKSKTKNQNTKTSGGKETVATQLAQVSVQALKGVKPKASDNTSQTETIPQYDPFPQGSMPKTLYDIRNAEMADLKVQQDKVDEVNQLVNQYRQEAAAKGVDLDAELAKMNDYTGENKSIEELAVELDMEKHPEKYPQDSSAQKPQSVKIDSTNVKDYLDPDRYLEDYEVEAAKAYIDEYKKTHEGFEDTVTLYNDAPNQVARYNRENGTNYTLKDYLNANGVSMDEYQEALSVQALEQKLSNFGAFASGFTRKESNMANLPDRIGDFITGGAMSRAKADIERNATEAEKAAMFYSDLEKSRREKTTKAQETQNPLAYGAGSLTRMAYDTALTKGIGDALLEGVNIPALNSDNPVVKNLAEIGLDTALVDIPTDTIPEIIENYNNGMPMDEIMEKAGWNVVGNVGINTLMDWVIPSYISNMGKEATQQAEKEAAEYAENLGISTPFDLSSENVNALIPSINNADNVSRQLQDSLNNQIEEPIRSVTDIPGEEPITVRQDIEGLQNQWDDYLKDISNETPGSLEVRAPKLDDYLQRTYESYMDDLAKATSTEDIVEIMQKATLDLRAGSLSEEQFQNLIKVAQGDAAVDTAAGVVGDTVASNVMRTGLDTIHPEHGVSVGEMVTQLTDDMRTSVDDFGTKYADLLNKNETIRTKYDNLSKAVDDFNNAALHTDENLDDYYRKIDATRKNLQRNLKKVDEGASKDVIFSNSKNGVIKRADQARYHIKNDITINDPNEAMDWLPGFEGMTRSEMEDSAKDLFAEEAPRNIPNVTTSSPRPQASGGSNVPGANRLQFFSEGDADGTKWRTSSFRTNTAEKMGWGDAMPKEDYAHTVFTEAKQHEVKTQRYKDSVDVTQDLLNKDYDAFDEVDIKEAMDDIQSLMDEGRTFEANRLAQRTAYELRSGGRKVQAVEEYTRNTASGALKDAYKTQEDKIVGPWKSRNKKAVEGNSRLASALAKMGDDTKTVTGGTVQLTHDQVKQGVIAELEKEFGSIEKVLTDDDIDYITSMVETKSIPVWQITSEIEHRFNHGEWYPLYEDFELPKPKNQKLQNALNDLVNKKVRTEKPPKTFDQIKEEVQNTLDSDFASFGGNFNDSDIDYLSNMISQGASKQEIEEALNTRLATGTWGISEETQKAVNDLFKQARQYNENSKEFVELQMEAYRRLANEIAPNATALEKFDSWRYLAMLGNPKTMLRNAVGNMTFNLVTSFSNSVAALGEAGIDKVVRGGKGLSNKLFGTNFDPSIGIQRTKSLLLNPTSDADLIKTSWADANNSRFRQLTGSKYEKFNDDSILGARSTFKSKPMQTYEKIVDVGTNDYLAARTKYSTSLAGYLKANGYDNSIFDAEVKLDELKNLSKQRLLTDTEKASIEQLTKDVNVLEKARDYAVKQADYATFHEDNKIANVLSEWSRASKERGTGIGSKVIEGTVPFKRTPANVLRSALQYSPLGAIDSIRKTGKLIYENTGKRAGNLAETYINKKGKEVTKTLAADVIDSWSKTLTGVGLVGLGVYMYDKGILNVSDKDLKYQDQLEGRQNYSITINGHTYTIDWAAPSAIPLFLGAELAKIWPATGKDTENLYDNLDGYLAAFTRMADPVVETSMLSGIRDTFESAATAVQNNDKMDMLTSVVAGALTSYATQAIPTFSGQLARTIDNTRRSTYTDKEGAAGAIDRQIKKTMNKLPVLSFLNEPYVDTYGRQQQNSPFGNPIANFAYQTLSPGYLADVNTTAADTLSRNMYNIDQDTKMLPAYKGSAKVGGERVSPEDYTKYATAYGKANYEIRTALANDSWFNSLTPTEQKAIVEGINNVANKVGMAEIDPDFESDDGAYTAYKEFGMEGLLDYYKEATEKNHVKNVAKEAGADKKFSVTDSVLKAYEEGITVNGKTVKGDDAVTMYTQAAMYLKENGMDNNEKNRQMYYDNQLTELQKRKTVTDVANKYDMEYSTQNAEVLDTYGEKGLEAKQLLAESGYDFDKDGYTRSLYEQGGLPAIQGYVDDMNALTGSGLKASSKVYKAYQHALDNNPDMTVTQYANAVKKIDDNDNSEVSQDEMLGYINDGNYSEEEVMWMWNTFGDWKRIPVYSNGKWSAKNT